MYTIYTKDNCTYCEQAKSLLASMNIPFVAFKLGEDITRDELLTKFPGARTMPQIMKDDQVIGGFLELKRELSA